MSYSVEKEDAPAVEDGIWIFVFADMCMFAMFFLAYLMERNAQQAMYIASQAKLDQTLGTINTLILLLSSWFVVLAVKALKKNLQQAASVFIGLAFFCGVAFIANKIVEYSAKIQDGITILSNDFFMFYYILTGIHLAHVVGGMVVLLVLFINTRKGKYGADNISPVESGGVYWHMVDLLWVFIFPLIYFLGA
ncbi:heme/copper-type cytochrome/quinol oxidase, subunit 3 [Spongiibacter sp. IMCC21906]|uniref:cytochrome c oxidase subunit 3 n=1 Tax=Spongiibacter sp. IMCC21906 TaxID=1620392 RepID=UPI00062DDA65|nr:cytochrome c oxidase subunit 3 [Spongiibacter sp. IMCC21906]AKH67742.1 heme/copper-type cytochrome/quinol oxidase, subunit 3 [Spongiibacter sp. IMCC21906]